MVWRPGGSETETGARPRARPSIETLPHGITATRRVAGAALLAVMAAGAVRGGGSRRAGLAGCLVVHAGSWLPRAPECRLRSRSVRPRGRRRVALQHRVLLRGSGVASLAVSPSSTAGSGTVGAPGSGLPLGWPESGCGRCLSGRRARLHHFLRAEGAEHRDKCGADREQHEFYARGRAARMSLSGPLRARPLVMAGGGRPLRSGRRVGGLLPSCRVPSGNALERRGHGVGLGGGMLPGPKLECAAVGGTGRRGAGGPVGFRVDDGDQGADLSARLG